MAYQSIQVTINKNNNNNQNIDEALFNLFENQPLEKNNGSGNSDKGRNDIYKKKDR